TQASASPSAQASAQASGVANDVAKSSQSTETETETETETVKSPLRGDVTRLLRILGNLIEANGSKRPSATQGNYDAMRLLLDRDERDAVEVEQIIRWCQADDFWRSNILSAKKLRAKYDTLRLQM